MKAKRCGVILVIVLLMLALAATIAAQVASHTIRLTAQAASSEREMRERWAIVSLRRTILQNAASLLTTEGSIQNQSRFLATREDSIVLAGSRYQMILQDESSKIPVSRVTQSFGPLESKQFLRQFLRTGLILRPVIPKSPTQWQEVVDTDRLPANLLGNTMTEVGRQLTLWSDGRINVMTADLSVLDAVWQAQFKAPIPETFLAVREGTLGNNRENMWSNLGLSERELAFANSWFKTVSSCHSLWLSREVPGRDRTLTALYVRRGEQGFSDEHFGIHP
jgi:hypothetical protein